MKVQFSSDALAQPDAFRHLTSMAWMFLDGRHHWVIEDLKGVKSSRWLADEGPFNHRLFGEFADKAARRTHRADLLVSPIHPGGSCIDKDDNWHVSADLAAGALLAPLLIIVENAKCDGAFLRRVMLRVGERRLKRHLGDDGFERLKGRWSSPLGDGEWLAVRHGGGSTTGTQVELAAEVGLIATRRILVLVDSDYAGPNAKLGPTASNVKKVCDELKASQPRLQLHIRILTKREVENYIPREALRQYNTRGFARWEQLAEQDRDFADLKEIFNDKLWRVFSDDAHSKHFHNRSLRERAGGDGSELDAIVADLVAFL